MSYYESAEGITISKARAKKEVVDNHGSSWEEFIEEMGDKEEYNAQDVLAWLGY